MWILTPTIQLFYGNSILLIEKPSTNCWLVRLCYFVMALGEEGLDKG